MSERFRPQPDKNRTTEWFSFLEYVYIVVAILTCDVLSLQPSHGDAIFNECVSLASESWLWCWQTFALEVSTARVPYQFWRMYQRIQTTARTRVRANTKDEGGSKLCSDEKIGRAFLRQYKPIKAIERLPDIYCPIFSCIWNSRRM